MDRGAWHGFSKSWTQLTDQTAQTKNGNYAGEISA